MALFSPVVRPPCTPGRRGRGAGRGQGGGDQEHHVLPQPPPGSHLYMPTHSPPLGCHGACQHRPSWLLEAGEGPGKWQAGRVLRRWLGAAEAVGGRREAAAASTKRLSAQVALGAANLRAIVLVESAREWETSRDCWKAVLQGREEGRSRGGGAPSLTLPCWPCRAKTQPWIGNKCCHCARPCKQACGTVQASVQLCLMLSEQPWTRLHDRRHPPLPEFGTCEPK